VGRGNSEGANEGWWVIADSSQVGSRLPLTAERFGEHVVLWREPTGIVLASRVRPDEGFEDSSDAETLVVHEAHGWIWAWRGDGEPDRAVLDGLTDVPAGAPDSLSSHVWDMPVRQAMQATFRARPTNRLLASNLGSDTLNEHIGIITAFVPIDERRTEVLVRSDARRATVTGLGWLMTSMMQRRARRALGTAPRPIRDQRETQPTGAGPEAN